MDKIQEKIVSIYYTLLSKRYSVEFLNVFNISLYMYTFIGSSLSVSEVIYIDIQRRYGLYVLSYK
jgi:hypothetical protein